MNFPTRFNNTLDLALLPALMPYDRLQAISAPAEKCDHLAFKFRAFIPKYNARLVTRLKWKFDNDASVPFCDSLFKTDWSSYFSGKSSSEQAEIFEEVVVSTSKKYNRLISIKQKFGQVNYPLFMTRAVRSRDRAFRKWKAYLPGSYKDRAISSH